MSAIKILYRSREMICKAIRGIDQQIADVREKYPYEVYGCKADEKVDRLKAEQKMLSKQLEAWDHADITIREMEEMKIQLQQKQRCIEDLQAALYQYDPAEAERIRRRWRQ